MLLFLPTSLNAATLEGHSYPYYIFNDDHVIRWCMDPGVGSKTTICWTKGQDFLCDVLKPEDGYIDCKLEDE